MTAVNVVADRQSLIEKASEFIIIQIEKSITSNGICTIALAGGSTPKPIYEKIAAANLPWDKIHIFWGDERYVPKDHQDSNYKMTVEAWLNKVEIPETNIHPIPTDDGNPEVSAQKHNQELKDFFSLANGDIPPFDIILLGMGDDGHTASLFPYTKALDVNDRLITVGNKDDNQRITFTAPLINNAQQVIFLVSGSNKQDALAQVFSTDSDSKKYPSKLIKPQGELIWFIDEDAAVKIKS